MNASNCPDIALLEEYVSQRLRGVSEGSPALEEHLTSCEHCIKTVETLTYETNRLMQHLASSGSDAAGTSCLALDAMARYLDGSISVAEREATESHLAHCAQCRRALVELYREVKAVLRDEAEQVPLFPVETTPISLAQSRHALPSETVSANSFDMQTWLKTSKQTTSARVNERANSKQRKPRQSTY